MSTPDPTTETHWGFIIGVGLMVLVIIGCIAYIIMKARKTTVETKDEIGSIKTFSGFYCPPMVSGAGSIGCGDQHLVTNDGNSLISCPIGKKINIIGAYFEVYDPYLQCTATPTDDLTSKCAADSTYISCTNTTGASGGWTNPVCQAGGPGECVSRDASAYLQAYVDTNCSDPTKCIVPINEDAFGPPPCSDSSAIATTEGGPYGALPLIQGSMGTDQQDTSGQPVFSADATPIPPTTNQGYQVHGLYRCIPA